MQTITLSIIFLVSFSSMTAKAESLGGYEIDLSKEAFLKAYLGFKCQDFSQGPKDMPEAAVVFTECHKPDPNFPDNYFPNKPGHDERHNLAAVRFYENKIVELVIRIPDGISTKMASEQLSKKKSATPVSYHIAKTPTIDGSYYAGAGGTCSALYTLSSGLVYATALPVQGKVNLKYIFDGTTSDGKFSFENEINPRCEQVMNSEKAASLLFYVNSKSLEKSNRDIEANVERLKKSNQTGFKF